MKVSHEVPLFLMEQSRSFNDFDYALVHLFEQSEDYYLFFKESLLRGREVILDNSVFELGHPVDESFYQEWILKLNPTYFIAPDYFCHSLKTIQSVKKWALFSEKYNKPMIGVIQGNSIQEFVDCYSQIEPYCQKVAISFAQPLFSALHPDLPIDHARMLGRVELIGQLIESGVINLEKEHHLLGLALPQELLYYRDLDFIASVDSSSPIVHGYLGVEYSSFGLAKKDPLKLVDIMFKEPENIPIILRNVEHFKNFSV